MTTILLCSLTHDLSRLQSILQRTAPEFDIQVWPAPGLDPDDVGAAVCWYPPSGVLSGFPRLRMISSVAAGVDSILADPQLPEVPVCRVIDPNLAPGMAEYVGWATLYYHRGFDEAVASRRLREWRTPEQRAAAQTRVGVMGLGVLGLAAANFLRGLGFDVSGWSRTQKQGGDIATFAGIEELPAFLADRDIVVCLLPLTPLTRGILGKSTFALMKRGAALINCGRGEHLVASDLVAALDAGQLRGAVLDVFPVEPLAADSPLWSDPRVVVTPHMASAARLEVIAEQIVANARKVFAGTPPLNTVDRVRGY
ncbi:MULTISPECIES: 2-hydroxyacid dehydrogenase [unclassified Caballeronia]|uniref:2-hydroxyacid dehydrogenase n=1 Tax=unclassified Caballeronia TaxID=2646786 RepID=UPI003ECE6147